MSSASSVAATLRPETRPQIALEALEKSKPISHLATNYEVSRKFVYEQSDKAKLALDDAFEPTIPDKQVLVSPADHQKLAVSIDSWSGVDLPQFVERRRRAAAGRL